MTDSFPRTAAAISAALENREFSSVEITRHYLDRIATIDDELNSYITVCEDRALKQARAADEIRAAGRASILTGVPYANKDIFCTKETRTSCGSRMLDNFIAPYNATVVEHLDREGMVMLGKTNMDEFAMGSSNETSYYGPVRNPWDLERVPGGSSGGSAAAVAAGLAPVATGTDTGGSIRQPAAFCGISGLKPTYGRVSRFGMIAFASSLDQGGPLALTAEDLALMMNVIAGFDERDSTSSERATEDFASKLNDSVEGLRIGVPKEFFDDALDPDIGDCVSTAVEQLEKLGARAREISLASLPLSIPAYYVIAPAECSSNLSRYDGVRYGHRCENPKDLMDLYCRSRAEGFGAEVKRRILVGAYALSSGYYDAYYRKAQQVRRLIKQDFESAFAQVDVIIGPTTPTTAFRVGEHTDDPVSMYLSDIYTTAVNLSGVTSLSVPAGYVDGLPVGMQIIGNYFDEARLLNLAHVYQTVTDWHLRVAPCAA
ncbi:MAG: Asp-tRNA(Asn)/Glu-tRNA(Gln) amidotransferase subunit GatA [Gammaproteobacteria bacterium]|nr:Asp-tRNA(Asn)/Glu-tRNA(Gln) amidotransferase subunit GatA [Gammaproteobacteria bacterium]